MWNIHKMNFELILNLCIILEMTDVQHEDFFQNICFKERSSTAVAPNFWATINLYKKLCLPGITWNKKTSIEARMI